MQSRKLNELGLETNSSVRTPKVEKQKAVSFLKRLGLHLPFWAVLLIQNF
jgi:hypothetical protein